ncbi:unnamed protein product [Lactuca saligna]|uniref:NAC domain-containing protein n=1 Tax=Lactuca saligna TaxID=75948 RepID=A0AA36EBS6_LACSI|nr:unnamed protein product [Lactuca saligna]
MGGASLPPGFRFHPTEEELIGYYLKRKVQGLEIELEVIPVINFYKFEPWELPEKSFLPNHDMEWFFFCPRDRKYPNGSRTNRATNAGYWKATGKDRKVLCQSSLLGYRKTLVFYNGRAPTGNRTCWVMHEYRLCDDVSQGTSSFQEPFVLCRVMKKNKQRTSYVNSEPETKGDGSSESNISSPLTSFQTNEPTYSIERNDPPSFQVSPDLILESSKEVCEGGVGGRFGYFQRSEIPTAPWQSFGISPSSSYSNFTEEDDLIQFGSMSPLYLGDENLMEFFENEDHDWTNSHGNLNPF